jgi:hypothetical protein
MKKVKLSVEYQLRTDDNAHLSENTAPWDESDHQKEVEEQPEDVSQENAADPAEEEEERATKEDEPIPVASEGTTNTELTEDNPDDEEFIHVSQEEAPIELAEEYPVVEVFSKFIRLMIDS